MFRIDELSGHLIKSGRFDDAIPAFYTELDSAVSNGVITYSELIQLSKAFASILLNPSDYNTVQLLGDKMIALALRIPGKLPVVDKIEYEKNVKKSREDNKIED